MLESSDPWLRPPAGSVRQKHIQDQANQSLRLVSGPRNTLSSHASFFQAVPLKRNGTWHIYVRRSSTHFVTLDQPSSVSERSVARSRVARGLWICWTNRPGHSLGSRAPGGFCQLWLNNANYISSFLWLALSRWWRIPCVTSAPGLQGSSLFFSWWHELRNKFTLV